MRTGSARRILPTAAASVRMRARASRRSPPIDRVEPERAKGRALGLGDLVAAGDRRGIGIRPSTLFAIISERGPSRLMPLVVGPDPIAKR
jgi:hypothetical protein